MRAGKIKVGRSGKIVQQIESCMKMTKVLYPTPHAVLWAHL